MLKTSKRFFIGGLIFFSLSGFCQKYSFRNYTVADGLGSSSLNHIFQDKKGFIWFACQGGGVSRFSGSDFQNFTKADGLVNNDVTFISEDNWGNIWIATAAGVSRFDGLNFQNFGKKEGLTDGVVFSIFSDKNDRLWFATQDAGVKIFDGKIFDSLTIKNGLPTNEIYTITGNNAGDIWIGTAAGIAKFSDGEIKKFHDESISGLAFFCSFHNANEEVWFGSTSGEIITINRNDVITKIELPDDLKNDFIGGITQDHVGKMWLATDHGLVKYENQNFKIIGEEEGLSVNTAQTVFCDYEGNIWTGTLVGGACLLTSEAFVRYAEKDGLESRNVTCIQPAIEGVFFYMGTGAGLYIFDTKQQIPFQKITSVKALNNTQIISLSQFDKDILWLCTQDEVFVLKVKDRTLEVLARFDSLAGHPVISPTKIIHDKKGNCWISTYGSGIFKINYDPQKIKFSSEVFNTKNGFPTDKILTVFEDHDANIWVGTQDSGRFKFDGKNFIPQGKDLTNDRAVWCFTQSIDGDHFFGTGESGVCFLDEKKVTFYNSTHGLNAENISSIAFDEMENSLWVGSEKGLEKIVFDSENNIEKIVKYGQEHGFGNIGVNHNSIYIDEQGLVYLGTIDGLWIYDRKNDVPRKTAPKIQLIDVRLFFQAYDWRSNFSEEKLKLTHNQNHLTFDIQAITTNDAQYIFKLEGQDRGWSTPTKTNEITYSNILPGSYIFKAKAINSEGVMSAENIEYAFVVAPPWWSTWWFRMLTSIMVVAALFLFIKAREKVLKERNIKLEESVKQRTYEIARQKEIVEKTLYEKEGLLHEKEILLKEIHHRVKNNLQTISSMLMLQGAGLKDEQAKRAINESQSRVRSIALVHQKLYQTEGIEKVELDGFIKDLTMQIKSVYRQSQIHFDISLHIPPIYILIDTAIPLGLILNELLTNSFKYASNGKNGNIKIQVEHVNDIERSADAGVSKKIELTYIDNGEGFDFAGLAEKASTMGVRLITLLSKQIGATVNYSNENGSRFQFLFKINSI